MFFELVNKYNNNSINFNIIISHFNLNINDFLKFLLDNKGFIINNLLLVSVYLDFYILLLECTYFNREKLSLYDILNYYKENDIIKFLDLNIVYKIYNINTSINSNLIYYILKSNLNLIMNNIHVEDNTIKYKLNDFPEHFKVYNNLSDIKSSIKTIIVNNFKYKIKKNLIDIKLGLFFNYIYKFELLNTIILNINLLSNFDDKINLNSYRKYILLDLKKYSNLLHIIKLDSFFFNIKLTRLLIFNLKRKNNFYIKYNPNLKYNSTINNDVRVKLKYKFENLNLSLNIKTIVSIYNLLNLDAEFNSKFKSEILNYIDIIDYHYKNNKNYINIEDLYFKKKFNTMDLVKIKHLFLKSNLKLDIYTKVRDYFYIYTILNSYNIYKFFYIFYKNLYKIDFSSISYSKINSILLDLELTINRLNSIINDIKNFESTNINQLLDSISNTDLVVLSLNYKIIKIIILNSKVNSSNIVNTTDTDNVDNLGTMENVDVEEDIEDINYQINQNIDESIFYYKFRDTNNTDRGFKNNISINSGAKGTEDIENSQKILIDFFKDYIDDKELNLKFNYYKNSDLKMNLIKQYFNNIQNLISNKVKLSQKITANNFNLVVISRLRNCYSIDKINLLMFFDSRLRVYSQD
jgi:hypothetical protein